MNRRILVLLLLGLFASDARGQMVTSSDSVGPPITVADLPAASTTTGQIWAVRDGTDGNDCVTGGGTTLVLCRSTGSAYTNLYDVVSIATGTSVNIWMGTSAFTTLTGSGIDNFFPIFGARAPSTNEASGQMIAPRAGTLSKLICFLTSAPGAGTSYTFTFRKNGANGNNTCSIAGTAFVCTQDTTHTDSISIGDLVAVNAVGVSTPADRAGGCSAIFSTAAP